VILLLTINFVHAQSTLSIALSCSPVSGPTPFSPICDYTYVGSVGAVRIVIHWGDGSSTDMSSCVLSCPSHSYTQAGTYTISIAITDNAGNTATDSEMVTAYSARPQATYDLQVGALGDSASIGNTGVGVEIRTQIYSVGTPDLSNSFWVGDNLQNGAFVQFGYELFTPGRYCLYSEQLGSNANCLGAYDSISIDDARWFWQYWPNANVTNFYSGIGPANSAGQNTSWHLYQIWPNVDNGWNFVLDGQTVWSFATYPVTASKDPAYVVAEEVTDAASASGNLGPVEFRNLTYWTTNGWNRVNSLSAISGCGSPNPACGVSIPYGVSVVGANDVLIGSGEQPRTAGEPLWTGRVFLTIMSPFASSGEGWYNQGTVANFSTSPVYITNSGGVAIFQGWYDENGNLFSTSDAGGVTMSEPYTLYAHWWVVNYLLWFTAGGLAVAILLIATHSKRRR